MNHPYESKTFSSSQKPTTPAAPKKTLSQHAWFIKWWFYSFEKLTGEKYAINKKSAGIVKNLLDSLTLEELVMRTCTFLTMSPGKRFPRGSPTLEGLAGMVNQIAGLCTTETEDALFKVGILPDYGVDLITFKPWETPSEDHQLPLH